jgi:hypothetical protein
LAFSAQHFPIDDLNKVRALNRLTLLRQSHATYDLPDHAPKAAKWRNATSEAKRQQRHFGNEYRGSTIADVN